MDKPAAIKCPRCNSHFTCMPDNIAECSCSGIRLDPNTLAFLSKTKYVCLCNNCLNELNTLIIHAQADAFPSDSTGMQEGRHYYMEDGLLVFSEYYHILRGYCCESGCRHCAYGFKIPNS